MSSKAAARNQHSISSSALVFEDPADIKSKLEELMDDSPSLLDEDDTRLPETDDDDVKEVTTQKSKAAGASKKKQVNAAEKKKLKNKRLRDDVLGWMNENKSELKKLKKAPKAYARGPAFDLDSVNVLKKEFMKQHKKKEDEVHLTHILPLFMFLRKTEIILEGIGEFDGNYKGKTSAGEEHIKEIEKMIKSSAAAEGTDDEDEDDDMKVSLSTADLEALKKKYGRKWWKLPKQGVKGKQRFNLRPFEDPRRFQGKRKVKVTLLDVAATIAEISDDRSLAFISPILAYEYA